MPSVPGLVRLRVVPEKSSAVSAPWRALCTMASYADQNWAKFIASQPLIDTTTSERAPPRPGRSIARPRLTWSGVTTVGRPSMSAKCRFIEGYSASARTTANPIRWVKEIFPPRVRRNWLLITRRLSASSFAGTARTLVAVGTSSEACMFFTTADAAPRNGVAVPSSTAGAGRAAFEALPAAGFSGADFCGAGFDRCWPGGRGSLRGAVARRAARCSSPGPRAPRGPASPRSPQLSTPRRRARRPPHRWPHSLRRSCPRLPAGSRRRSRARPGRPQ